MEHIDKIIRLQDLAIIVISIVISIIDIKSYRIPDILLLILSFILIFSDFFKGYNFVLNNLLSAAIIFIIFFAIYYFIGSMGFGDVKYAAVLAYGLGIKYIYISILIATISGLLLYLAGYLVLGWNKKTKIPFAPLLSTGVIFSLVIRRFV